ncbi:hypothetical protein BH11PLA2_BH11PLA2_35030 [soil metagenome]
MGDTPSHLNGDLGYSAFIAEGSLMADSLPPKRRFRWLKRFAVLGVLLALLLFFAPAILSLTGLFNGIVAKATKDFDGKITVGGSSLGWLKPIELRDVKVLDAEGRTIADVPRIVTENSLLSLIRDRVNLGTVIVERPVIEIVCEKNSTNLEACLSKILNAPSSEAGPPPRFKLSIVDGSVKVIDTEPKAEWAFTKLTGSADMGDAKVIVLTGVAANRDFVVDVNLGTTITAKITTDQFPLAVLGPFLRRYEPGLVLEGALTSNITTESAGDTVTVAGAMSVLKLNATSPRFGDEKLTLNSINLPCKLVNRGSLLTIQEANLTCDIGTATLVGSIDTAEPLEKLVQRAGLNATASVDVAKLFAMFPKRLHLLPGTTLNDGRLKLTLNSRTKGTTTIWDGTVRTTSLKGTREGRAINWEQPLSATFAASLDAKLQPNFETLQIVSEFATLTGQGQLENFTAQGDVSLDLLAAKLREFVDLSGVTLAGTVHADVRSVPEANATAMSGTLKLGSVVVTSKPDWDIAGQGTLSGSVRLDAKSIRASGIKGDLARIRFHGLGLDIDEPIVKVYPTDIVVNRENGRIDLPALQMATQSFSVGAQNVSLIPNKTGTSVAVKAALKADLGRVQRMLGLQTDPRQNDAINGTITNANIDFSTDGGPMKFNVAITVSDLRYGPPQKPTWQEPNVSLKVQGELDPAADSLRVISATIELPEGQAVTASGSVTELKTRMNLDLAGKLSYDLAKLQVQLKDVLGPHFKATGKETRDFKVTGALEDKNSVVFNLLDGTGSIAWQSLVAYGFDVGAASLDAQLKNGTLTTNPVTAKFGESGTVKLQPTLRLNPGTYDLTFQKGRIIDKAKLTPQATADAIGFALPAIAKSTQAEGTISFDLDDHRLMITDMPKSTLKGKLTLHDVTVSSGPVVTEIAALFGQKQPRMNLANEQVVAIRLENGRVYHEGLNLTFNGFTITTSGSVGFDGTLQMTALVPLPESAVGPLLKSVPKLKEAIVNKKITIAIAGTLDKPSLDNKAFQVAIKKFADEVLKDAVKGKANEFLENLLQPPKKP